MNTPYLEVTFRHGRPFAAYCYLPTTAQRISIRSRPVDPGLVVDFAKNGEPLGIEITAPSRVSLSEFNALLTELGRAPIDEQDFAPLHAA